MFLLFAMIGGLQTFLFTIFTPFFKILFSNNFKFSLISALYWVNETDPAHNKGKLYEKTKNWCTNTKVFEVLGWQMIYTNPVVQFLLGRRCKSRDKRDSLEKIIAIGS